MRKPSVQAGASQVVVLVLLAVVLAVAYVAIDRYSEGQKDVAIVETRGVQMMAALSAFKRDQGSYPDALDKLVPKYAAAVARCPSGTPIEYRAVAGEYVLSCPRVVFKYMTYGYDSRSRNWGG